MNPTQDPGPTGGSPRGNPPRGIPLGDPPAGILLGDSPGGIPLGDPVREIPWWGNYTPREIPLGHGTIWAWDHLGPLGLGPFRTHWARRISGAPFGAQGPLNASGPRDHLGPQTISDRRLLALHFFHLLHGAAWRLKLETFAPSYGRASSNVAGWATSSPLGCRG